MQKLCVPPLRHAQLFSLVLSPETGYTEQQSTTETDVASMLKQKWVLPALAGLIVVMVVVICLLGRQGSGGEEADFFQEEPGEVEQTTAGNAEALLAKLSTEQKVGQLFLILPDALTEEPTATGTTTLSAKELKALETYPVGGFVLTGSNIQDKDQLNKLLGRLKKTSSVTPLFALQEEGGMGATIAGKEAFGLAKTETPAALGSTGDGAKVKEAATTIGKALADLGFQMNLAPTCDVGSALSFHEAPEQAAMCTSAAVEGFHEGGVACVLKHYPGQGGTNASEGASLTETWETMRTTSLYPFQAGMAAGADAIMVSHVTTPNASSDGLPASLSQEMITSKLRGELRFSRLIMTAPLSDPAIAQHYDSGDAALRAFQAGADILLQPEDLSAAYTAVLSAVKDGTISQQRLDESVLRVLQLKERYGLI